MSSRFVVTRANWRRFADGVYRLPGTVDLAAFDTRAEADAECRRRETDARSVVNPFTWGDNLFDVTRLPIHPLTDWLIEAGLAPPSADAPRAEWAAWWDAQDPGQRAGAWPAFDKLLPLHAVEERPGRPTLTVLTLIPWTEPRGADGHEANVEGGLVAATFRGRPFRAGVADAMATAGGAFRLDEYDHADVNGRVAFNGDPSAPPPPGAIQWVPSREVPALDEWPVEAIGPNDEPPADRAYLVVRSAWRRSNRSGLWGEPARRRPRIGLPLVAHPTREAADADAWQRDLEARRYLNPFRFGPPTELSSVAEVGYRGVLRDLGLDLPDAGWSGKVTDQRVWAAWWEGAGLLLTDDQRETVWDLFDQLRFHQVVELEVRG
jgi:hypothetical protein